ncbi:unnamed protein product [Urochloa humidicola]
MSSKARGAELLQVVALSGELELSLEGESSREVRGYIRELGGAMLVRPSGIVLHQPKWQVHMWSLTNPDKWQNCAA